MVFIPSEDILDIVKCLTKNLTAKRLTDVINAAKDNYIVWPHHLNIVEETIVPKFFILGPISWLLYMGYRNFKLSLRLPNADEITDENAKQMLFTILNDDGGNDKKSFKWNLLYFLGIFIKNNSDQIEKAILVKINKFVELRYLDYTDADVESFIEEIKLNLVDQDKVPNQIVSILDNYISRNSSKFTWQESQSILDARLMRNNIMQHFMLGQSSDSKNFQLGLAGTDTRSKMKDFLTTTKTDLYLDQNNLTDLCTRLKGYLDSRLDMVSKQDVNTVHSLIRPTQQ